MKEDLGAYIKKNLVNINNFTKQKIQCKEHINGKALCLVKMIRREVSGSVVEENEEWR